MHYGRLIRFLGLLALYIYLSPKDNPLDKVLIKNAKTIIKIVEKGIKGKKVDLVTVAPELSVNKDLYVKEQGQSFLTTENLNCFDKDSQDREIVYTILKVPNQGVLYLNGFGLTKGQSFTQADLRSEKLFYKHAGGEILKDELVFTLQDADDIYAINASKENPGVLNIFINPINDRPRLMANSGLTAREQERAVITANVLNTQDVDSADSNIIYSLIDIPKFGVILKNNKVLDRSDTFSQNDVTQGRIVYEHRSESNEKDLFKFSINDTNKMAAMMANEENPGIFEISIEPVNDAPRVLFARAKKVKEQGRVLLTARDIRSIDVDNNDGEISYVLARLPKRGVIYRDGQRLNQGDSFTQEELYDNAITYSHSGDDNKIDSFRFYVRDNQNLVATNATQVRPMRFKFSILPVNDRPILQLNNSARVRQFSKVTLGSKNLKSRDPDNYESEIYYKLVDAPKRGELKLENSTLGTDDYFSQSDIDRGLVVYEHDDDSPVRDEFRFMVSDKDGGVSENATENNPATFVLSVREASGQEKLKKWQSFYPSLSMVLGSVLYGGSYQNPNAVGISLPSNFREAKEIGGSLALKVSDRFEIEMGLLQRSISVKDYSQIEFVKNKIHLKHVYAKLNSLYDRWNFGIELSLINHSIITYLNSENNDKDIFDYVKRKTPALGIELMNSDLLRILDMRLFAKVGFKYFRSLQLTRGLTTQPSIRFSATMALERIVKEFSFIPELTYSSHKTVTNKDSQIEQNLLYRMRVKYRL